MKVLEWDRSPLDTPRMIISVVEYFLDTEAVVGSNPTSSTKQFAALADVVIAPVWSTEEWGSIPQGGTSIARVV